MDQGKRKKRATIGRRTGKDIIGNKRIRKENGIDVFDDYWTSSESSSENSTDTTIAICSSPVQHGFQRISSYIKDIKEQSESVKRKISFTETPDLRCHEETIPRAAKNARIVSGCKSVSKIPVLNKKLLLKNSSNLENRLSLSDQTSKTPKPTAVGRRTGVDIFLGKDIRKTNGIDNYTDYWTESEERSGSSDLTSQCRSRPDSLPSSVNNKNVTHNIHKSSHLNAEELPALEAESSAYESPSKRTRGKSMLHSKSPFVSSRNPSLAEVENMSENNCKDTDSTCVEDKQKKKESDANVISYAEKSKSTRKNNLTTRRSRQDSVLSSENYKNDTNNICNSSHQNAEELPDSEAESCAYESPVKRTREKGVKSLISSRNSSLAEVENMSENNEDTDNICIEDKQKKKESGANVISYAEKSKSTRKNNFKTRRSRHSVLSSENYKNVTHDIRNSFHENAEELPDSEAKSCASESPVKKTKEKSVLYSKSPIVSSRNPSLAEVENKSENNDKDTDNICIEDKEKKKESDANVISYAEKSKSPRKNLKTRKSRLDSVLSNENSKNGTHKIHNSSHLNAEELPVLESKSRVYKSPVRRKNNVLLSKSLDVSSRNPSLAQVENMSENNYEDTDNICIEDKKKKKESEVNAISYAEKSKSMRKKKLNASRSRQNSVLSIENCKTVSYNIPNSSHLNAEELPVLEAGSHVSNSTPQHTKNHVKASKNSFREVAEISNLQNNINQVTENCIPSTSSDLLEDKQKRKESDVNISRVEKSKSKRKKKLKTTANSDNENVLEDLPEEGQLRRSKRRKYPPLESWRQQRLKFKLNEIGELSPVLEEGSHFNTDPQNKIWKRIERQEKRKKQNQKKTEQKLDYSELNVLKTKLEMSKVPVINPSSGEEIIVYLHRPFSSLIWTVPPSQDEKDPSFLIAKSISGNQVNFGYLEIKVSKKKESQYSPTDNITFTVVQGKVKIKIYKSAFNLKERDMIVVPCSNVYSIVNTGKVNAILYFCSYTMPLFDYQHCSKSNQNDDDE